MPGLLASWNKNRDVPRFPMVLDHERLATPADIFIEVVATGWLRVQAPVAPWRAKMPPATRRPAITSNSPHQRTTAVRQRPKRLIARNRGEDLVVVPRPLRFLRRLH